MAAIIENIRIDKKILVQAFECLQGSISPKNQQKACIGSCDIDVQRN